MVSNGRGPNGVVGNVFGRGSEDVTYLELNHEKATRWGTPRAKASKGSNHMTPRRTVKQSTY